GVVADEDLDAELDAEGGHQQIKATKVESVEDQYAARLKILESTFEAKKAHCRSGRYCVKAAEEQFRRDKRALDARYEGHTNDKEFNRRRNVGFN
ncbi:MAG: hypothetical protein ACREXT_18660, partial [Gammaproteobacteria bacterium]